MKIHFPSLILFAALSFQNVISVNADVLPVYKDPTASVDRRVEDLLSRMTITEKIRQISHLHSYGIFDGQKLNNEKMDALCGELGFGFFEGFPLSAENSRKNFKQIQQYMVNKTRLGIPAFAVAESLHGVVHDGATIYPQNIALGSTFNPKLAYEKTKYIAGELNTMGIRQVLAPCIDVVRDLRWGRVEESYSEDPYLCAQMAVAETKGYLDHEISPMIKHYGPHGNPTGGLNLASVDCGVRDLFDIYLKPFEKVVKETNIMAVMSSYNAWNREPNSASYFMLTEILRNQFGFKGYVYSDWGVLYMLRTFHKVAKDDFEAASMALKAGLDVEAASISFNTLEKKIAEGKFDIRYVDQAVKRVLRAKFEMGLFDDPYQENTKFKLPIHADESIALSRRIANESTVLLKNENSLLPLDMDKLKSVAVIGPNADAVQFGDYTWSKNKRDGVTPLQGIKSLVGKKVTVNYAKGCSISSLDTSGIAEAVECTKKSDVALVFLGSSSTAFVRHSAEPSNSGEGIDLSDISLSGAQNDLIKAICETGKPVVAILVAGKPFAIPFIKKNVPAVLVQWYAGEQAGNSIADILFGKVNPSGKISFSFPQSTGHLPAYYNYLPTDKGYYNEPGSYEKPGRDYVFSSPDALWSFGHGLSYTHFAYSDFVSNKKKYNAYDTITIQVNVKNDGRMDGQEVVQVYVRDNISSVMTPVKQLKAFHKVFIPKGERRVVTLKIPVTELYLVDNFGRRYLEPGTFQIMTGTSSAEIYSTIEVEVGETEALSEDGEKKKKVAKEFTGKVMQVTGCVRDVQATPIPGVKVMAEHSKVTSLTDEKGCYVIFPLNDESLTFSKKGYESQTLDVDSKSQINVSLGKGN